ncbi:Sec8 exocyst complex component-specific domain-containing protein [Lipomyces tetrasporus]|uniref:Exocyst complex component Sec8 n=1 Tax=Lipomyces tetrasporus TaxID=54092 RepID=A0AAD7VTH9_9ASCO|nr:Sec8 exocyst complex component-specific domain-containing protein [Lipomyces tetrasporus]KAJ8100991.1 Sec8 exocyst complex component-specific domain-containing protein [Lipomyces tetrasporus]
MSAKQPGFNPYATANNPYSATSSGRSGSGSTDNNPYAAAKGNSYGSSPSINNPYAAAVTANSPYASGVHKSATSSSPYISKQSFSSAKVSYSSPSSNSVFTSPPEPSNQYSASPTSGSFTTSSHGSQTSGKNAAASSSSGASPYVRIKRQPSAPSVSQSSTSTEKTPPIPLRKSRSRTLRQPRASPPPLPSGTGTSPTKQDVQDLSGRSYDQQHINDVLKFVERDWGALASDDCNPVATALELMDTSSVGRASEFDDFKDLSLRLESIMQVISKDHYDDINNSITIFNEILTEIEEAETRVRQLRETLTIAKQNLTTKQTQMRGLAERAARYREMISILERIERLQGIAEKLESNITDKQYKKAYELLQAGLHVLKDNDLDEIVAVQSIKQYLRAQERALYNVMDIDSMSI